MRESKIEGLSPERELCDAAGVAAALGRIADAIVERGDVGKLVLVGIRTGGAVLAERLGVLLSAKLGRQVPTGAIDITLYRDDVFVGLPRPVVGATTLPGSLEGRRVVLVDDVLYTGRTVRAALVELGDFGRPERIELCVLVDRGHRELPIAADHVGLKVATGRDESVFVRLGDGGDRVLIFRKPGAAR